MNSIERVMRVMTHILSGAALGLAVLLLWSGWQVVAGQLAPAYRVAEVKALMNLAHAGGPAPMQLVPLQLVPLQLVPLQAGAGAPAPCHAAAPAPRQADSMLTGADL